MPLAISMSGFTTTGITNSFVDSGGSDANFLADVGETIRFERAILFSCKDFIPSTDQKMPVGPAYRFLTIPVSDLNTP